MPVESAKVVMAKKSRAVEEKEGARIEPGDNGIGGVLTRGGKYAEYDVYGNVFEITSKYCPPLKPIGRGAYGVVCSAFDKETNQGIAIKKISRAFDNKIDAKRTLREIKLLQYLKHENILAIKDFIPPPSRKEFNDVYIISELMDTDLGQIIRSRQALTEEHSKYFLYQILRALKYLHSANVLHRDLKPGNLLVNANCDLKICDFGMARTSDMSDFMTEYVVTRWYRAPELLLNAMDYDSAIDVWSVGCIFVELLTGEPLFPGRDYVHQLKSIIELLGTPEDCDLETVKSENARKYVKHLPSYERKPFHEKFPQLSKLALDLIEKMLTFNPNKRIKVVEALAHPYLSSLHDESDEPSCPKPFVFDFDEQSLTSDLVKGMLYEEALKFNPHLKCES